MINLKQKTLFILGFIALFFTSNSAMSETIPAGVSISYDSTCYIRTDETYYDLSLADCTIKHDAVFSNGISHQYYNWSGYIFHQEWYDSSWFGVLSEEEVYSCETGYQLTGDNVCESGSTPPDDVDIKSYFDMYEELLEIAYLSDALLASAELDVVSLESNADLSLDYAAQNVANSNEISSQSLYVDDLESLYPEISVLSDYSDALTDIDELTQSLADVSIDSATEASDFFTNGELIFDESANIVGEIHEGVEVYYDAYEGYLDSITVDESDGYALTMDSEYLSVYENYNFLLENTTIISDSVSSSSDTLTSSVSSSTTIVSNLTESTNIYESAISASENGETCVDDACVLTPDSTDVSQSSINATPSGASFYESSYPDGFSGVFDVQMSALKSTEFYASVGNFTFSGSGSPPTWQFPVGDFGTFDISLASYIWDFIRICLLITTVFLCRGLIFGG